MIQQVENTLEITEESSELAVQLEESALQISEVIQTLTIEQAANELSITEVGQELVVEDAADPILEIMPNAMLVQQFYSGDDATALNGTLVLTAGHTLSGHTPVYVENGSVFAASNDDLTLPGKVLGLTTHAATSGADVRVKFSGPLDEPSWSWTPGPVYVGLNGALTQTRPTSGWELNIGIATHSDRLVIMSKPTLLLN